MPTVIDQKSESHDFFVEKVTTTLTLIETNPDTFGISYDAVYSGVTPRGHVQGGPIAVSGNGHWTVNPQSGVTIDINVSNYSDDPSNKLISLHIGITVTAPVIGSVTIFDQTVGGRYGIDAVEEILNHLKIAASRST